jgi:Flp pilus assembly protein TadG
MTSAALRTSLASLRHKTRAKRSQKGIHAIEIVLASLLMIAMSGLATDTCVSVFAFLSLDSACRDACRAAAQQVDSAHAQTAAQRQLNAHFVIGNWISQPTLSSLVYNDYAGNPPANKSPFVSTTCTLSVTPPVQVSVFGINFADFLANGSLQFSRTYVFPIVRTKFYQ